MNLFILKSNRGHLSVIMLPYNVQTVVTSSTADQMDESQYNMWESILTSWVTQYLCLLCCSSRPVRRDERRKRKLVCSISFTCCRNMRHAQYSVQFICWRIVWNNGFIWILTTEAKSLFTLSISLLIFIFTVLLSPLVFVLFCGKRWIQVWWKMFELVSRGSSCKVSIDVQC